jgi:hypothetical protein
MSVSVLGFTALHPAWAQTSGPVPQQITGQALRDVFTDNTVISEYQSIRGIKHYQFSEHHNPDGTTDYVELGETGEPGLWKLVGDDKICYRYPGNRRFPDTYCFVVYKIDTCYYNFGTQDMTMRGPRNWDAWTSRFVVKGDGGVCGEGVS